MLQKSILYLWDTIIHSTRLVRSAGSEFVRHSLVFYLSLSSREEWTTDSRSIGFKSGLWELHSLPSSCGLSGHALQFGSLFGWMDGCMHVYVCMYIYECMFGCMYRNIPAPTRTFHVRYYCNFLCLQSIQIMLIYLVDIA